MVIINNGDLWNMAPPKFKFWKSLDPKVFQDCERGYLNVAVFSGKKDPTADVIQIRVTGLKNEQWETIGSIHLYKDKIEYIELPDTPPPVQKQESKDTSDHPSEEKQESKDTLDHPSEEENMGSSLEKEYTECKI